MFDFFPIHGSTLKKLIWLKAKALVNAVLKTITGNLIHITDALAKPVQALSIALEPIQAGSGDPSPDNIRPISGHTDADVTRTGKNLLQLYGKYGSNLISKNISLKEGTYTVSVSGINGNYATYIRKATTEGSISGDVIGNKVAAGKYTFTLAADENIMVQWYCPGDTSTDISGFQCQLESGGQATDYSPYVGTTYPFPLGQTVYGATVDTVTGVLTVTHTLGVYDGSNDEEWERYTQGSASSYAMSVKQYHAPVSNTGLLFKANYLKAISANTTWGNYDYFVSAANESIIVTGFKPITDVDVWRTYLSNKPLQIWYELATPQTVQLTPTQVELLLGENNIWSDGEMTLTYLADGNASDVEALNILLGGRYVNNHGEDEPTDREALDILLGGTR